MASFVAGLNEQLYRDAFPNGGLLATCFAGNVQGVY